MNCTKDKMYKIIELEYKKTKILDQLKELNETIKDLDEKEWTNNEVGSEYVRGIIYSFGVRLDLQEQLKRIDQELNDIILQRDEKENQNEQVT